MKQLYEYLGFTKQNEYDEYLDTLPNSIVRRLIILENKMNELAKDLDELQRNGYKQIYNVYVAEFFGYDTDEAYEEFNKQIEQKKPDLSNKLENVKQFLIQTDKEIYELTMQALLQEEEKIYLGNHILYRSKIISAEIEMIKIPQGNDRYVQQTDITVVEIVSEEGTYVVYENESFASELINNMISNAKLGKRKYVNMEIIKGGLSFFQDYYDNVYRKFTWIGADMTLTEVLNKMPMRALSKDWQEKYSTDSLLANLNKMKDNF